MRRHGEGHELARIETEAQRLDSMINDLLALSRGQQKSELAREQLKANELWGRRAGQRPFQEAEQMGKQLEITAPPGHPWTLFGNASALDSALETIVRNALRYLHTRIAVAFSADNQGVTIQVDDDGPASAPKTASRSSVRSIAPTRRRRRIRRHRPRPGNSRGGYQPASRLGEGAEDSPLGGLRLECCGCRCIINA